MTKTKSLVITGIAGVLLFCVLYLSSSYDIHWYNAFRNIFAGYGYVMAICVFYKWLREPSADPRHADIEVASGDTIPLGWINPFKTVKEKKNGNSEHAKADADGLPDAGDKKDCPIDVPGRPLDFVWAGNGDRPAEHDAEDRPAYC